jgi:hypothetical protein
MLRLYGDQLGDLTRDFIDQTGDLLDALGALGRIARNCWAMAAVTTRCTKAMTFCMI